MLIFCLHSTINYISYSDDFDTDIQITYWSSGWWGYYVASASDLHADGHEMINTHGDYYYILGKPDKFTTGDTTEHDPYLYTECASYNINEFVGGSYIEDPVGGMFCIWSDFPDAETETEVAENIRLILRAMSKRMDGEPIDNLDESVVEGGFNEDGTINGAHVHSFGEWTETKAATCTEKGEETRTCGSCGETETREIEALGHDYESVVTEPTCTEGGYTTHTCSRCGDSYTDSETAALGHDWSEWTETKAATCTEKGEETRTCGSCGETETRETEMTAHEYESVVVDPTETEQGYTEHTCKHCGDKYRDSYTDPVPGETDPSDPTDTTDPEETEPSVPETSKPAGENDSADTGDGFNYIWIFAMVIALAGAVILFLTRKKWSAK